MKPEDVPEEWWDMALVAYHRITPHDGPAYAMRAALAAVAPMIAAAECEQIAAGLEASAESVAPTGKRSNQIDRHVADVLRGAADAIRARGATP